MCVTEVGKFISYKSGHFNRAYFDAHYIIDKTVILRAYCKSLSFKQQNLHMTS
jgi:hypothetical protein